MNNYRKFALFAFLPFSLLLPACNELPMTESGAFSETRVGDKVFEFVPVYEFINFRCAHCYAFRDNMAVIRADYAGRISVRRIPLLRGDMDLPAARLYLLGELRGRENDVADRLFRAAFEAGKDITDSQVIAEIGRAAGLEPASDRERAAIDGELRRIHYLYKRYGIFRTPTLVVADAYVIEDGGSEQKHDNNLRVTLDRLLE